MSHPGQSRRDECFNGAAPVKERKTRLGRLGRGDRGTRFNGAAPVKERKTRTCPGFAIPRLLQWGRSGEGAEDGRPWRRSRIGLRASMGPLR